MSIADDVSHMDFLAPKSGTRLAAGQHVVYALLSHVNMAAQSSSPPSFPRPHTCRHCSTFVIHLWDEVQPNDTAYPLPPNASQEQLASRLFGDDFWTEEWTEYREYFFRRTAGISFFNASKDELEQFANDGCLLSQRYVDSLRGQELPDNYALGVMVVKEHGWKLELRILDLEDLRSEMILAEEDEEPDNIYSMLAQEGKQVLFDR